MNSVHKKKYFGDIITDYMNNYENIKEKTNKAIGIVNKISTTLIESSKTDEREHVIRVHVKQCRELD